MNLFIKHDMNIALHVNVQQEMDKLKVAYQMRSNTEIEITKPISQQKYKKLEISLKKYGIEIIDDPKNILIQKIKDVIIEMIFSNNFPNLKTSAHLANKLNLDYNYLSSLFSEMNFFSIQHYIILQKTERAKQLMIENKLTLSEVAWMLKYSSVAHLSNQFKKTTGLTPTSFQRIVKKRKNTDVSSFIQLNNSGIKISQNTLNILLADDDADDRLFFKEAIEEVKIKTVLNMVNNGKQLMQHLEKPETILPDVIFLDLNMPLKGGIECLTEIRKSSKLRHISIAIYSTSASEKDIEDTFVKGANIYITKPTDMNQLKKILIEVIRINWQYHKSGLNKENFLLSL